MPIINTHKHSQAAFTLAELVVAIALSGIIVVLCTKVYLVFTPQFRKDSENSETHFARLLKVSNLEKVMRLNVRTDVQPTGSIKSITPAEWLKRIKRLDRSPDSLAITWTLNQYARDSIYTIEGKQLSNHFKNLTEYYQDHLYLDALEVEVYERDKPVTPLYFLYSDCPNLTRIKAKELINETD